MNRRNGEGRDIGDRHGEFQEPRIGVKGGMVTKGDKVLRGQISFEVVGIREGKVGIRLPGDRVTYWGQDPMQLEKE